IKEATEVFSSFFGNPSESLIPPHFILDKDIIPLLKSYGIKYLQGGNRLINSNNKRHNFPVLRSRHGLKFSIRNARLDPDTEYKMDAQACLAGIKIAFDNKMPAIIDFHRVNFSGRFNPKYRDRSL